MFMPLASNEKAHLAKIEILTLLAMISLVFYGSHLADITLVVVKNVFLGV